MLRELVDEKRSKLLGGAKKLYHIFGAHPETAGGVQLEVEISPNRASSMRHGG